jgi:anti-anti-sigma regulatory factor
MKEADSESNLRVIEESAGELVVVEGNLTESNAARFESVLRAITLYRDRAITFDLSALDIDDAIAVATAVNVIRELTARSSHLILIGSPQILGHNLYRVGMLEGGAIELIDMRLDEASGL